MFCGFCDELFEYFNFSRSVKVKKRNRLICRQIEEVSVNFSISSKTIDQLFDQFKKCRSSSRLLPKLSINFSITFEKCRSFSRSVSEKFRSHFDRCRSFDRKLSTPWNSASLCCFCTCLSGASMSTVWIALFRIHNYERSIRSSKFVYAASDDIRKLQYC